MINWLPIRCLTIVVQSFWDQPTNILLDFRTSPWDGTYPPLRVVKNIGQDRSGTQFKKILKQPTNYMTPNYCTQLSVLPSHHLKSYLQKYMEINTETHSWTMCREWETFKYSVLNGCLHRFLLLGAQGMLWKRSQENCKGQSDWGYQGNKANQIQQDKYNMNSHGL